MKNLIYKAMVEKGYANNAGALCGIRTDERLLNVGDELGSSRDWAAEDAAREINFEEVEIYCDGTCATGFGYLWFDEDSKEDDLKTIEKAILLNKSYPGEHMYLIAGDGSEYGNDDAEVILSNAVVIAVLS